MADTECRAAERFEQLVRIWRALSPTRQARWTGRVLALGTRPGLMDRIAIAAAVPSVSVSLGSLGLDFFREVHQQARLEHRDRARRLADDALSYRAGADTRQASLEDVWSALIGDDTSHPTNPRRASAASGAPTRPGKANRTVK